MKYIAPREWLTTNRATLVFDNNGNNTATNIIQSGTATASNYETNVSQGSYTINPNILYPVEDLDTTFYPFFAGSFAQISTKNHALRIVFKFSGDVAGDVYAHLEIGNSGSSGYIANNWDTTSGSQFDYCYGNYKYFLSSTTTMDPSPTIHGENISSATNKNPSGLLKAAQKLMKTLDASNTTMFLTDVYIKFGIPGHHFNFAGTSTTDFTDFINEATLAKANMVLINPTFTFSGGDLETDSGDGQIRVKDDIYKQKIDDSDNLPSRIQII